MQITSRNKSSKLDRIRNENKPDDRDLQSMPIKALIKTKEEMDDGAHNFSCKGLRFYALSQQ